MDSMVTLTDKVRFAKENGESCPFRKISGYGPYCTYAQWLREKLETGTPLTNECINVYGVPWQWLSCPHMKRFLTRNPLADKPEPRPPRRLHPLQRRKMTWRQRVTPWRDF